MKWANFLHFYQPAQQQADILEAVATQCYRPVITSIFNNPKARMTININGSLLELFDKYGYQDLIKMLRELGERGQVEFVSSAKYHAFLPLLGKEEILRQIKINDQTNAHYLGEKAYRPKGFFSPEMGYSKHVAEVVEEAGFEWMILDEITATGKVGAVDYSKTYKIQGTKLKAFYRERRLSNAIMSAVVRNTDSLAEAMANELAGDKYVLTGMDGETFGHHRPGLEKLLENVYKDNRFELVTISELPDLYPEVVETEPVPSTWASSQDDIDRHIQFLSWKDPENPIHAWQWELFNLVNKTVRSTKVPENDRELIWRKMDIATASDHFWWASAKPWWSLEMIEAGAFMLLDVMRSVPKISQKLVKKAEDLYLKIISTACDWQRTGKVRTMAKAQRTITRIPFKDRTVGRGGAEEGVYHAFIKMMRDLEQKAVQNHEYEKAILWRDAVFKLENKLDIYEAINIIDLVRLEIPYEEIEKTIDKYKDEYRRIRGGQPEQRGA
ncbi:MAG TPA: hypothetical protein P5328_02150 [Candidatus Paceibacterota bacterium]|nr:hypothetical protein [Candidatus Paceibacterota bacterium]HRZ34446.1 hypothetical protein [Candidatus Paceibacterota bacterium]